MNGNSIVFFIVLVVLNLTTEDVNAGAWPQQRGHGFYKLGLKFIRANQFYEPSGNKIDIPTFGDYTTSFYGEYGLTDKLTLVAYFPFFKRITLNEQVGRSSGFVFFEGDEVSGVADADIGLRLGLLQSGPTVLSIGIKLGLPIGKDSQANGLLTGDGEFNQLLTFEIGQSFYPRPMYFTGAVGVNNRSKGYSDEFHYLAEFGYTFGSRFTVVVRLHGIESFKNGDDAVLGGMGGLYANNQRYLAYGPEIIYRIRKNFGITAGVEGASRAQNVLSAPAFSFGVFLEM
jgi:hypothetical protein